MSDDNKVYQLPEVIHSGEMELARPLTANEIRAQVNLVQEVMRSVMKEGVHFGKIPGTPKPTLFKPGAEKLLFTFRISTEPEIEDLSGFDVVRYRVRARALTQPDGRPLGSAFGECSSDEEKYHWRAALCNAEFDETPEDRRRAVWKKNPYTKKIEKVKQVRINPADVANTILKMASKRAKIAVTLDVTAASDIFSQDIEDLTEEVREAIHPEEEHHLRDPQAKQPEANDRSALVDAETSAENTEAERSGNPAGPLSPGIRVESVRLANKGTRKDKTEWTLWIVKLSDGVEYRTFSSTVSDTAKAACEAKLPVAFEYDTDEQQRKNLVLLEVMK